jgi:hypothetical protein
VAAMSHGLLVRHVAVCRLWRNVSAACSTHTCRLLVYEFVLLLVQVHLPLLLIVIECDCRMQ